MGNYVHDDPKDCKCFCHSGDPGAMYLSEFVPCCPDMGRSGAP